MTTFPDSPKLLKGGIVLIDPETAPVQRIIALQYNPDSLSRTLQIKGVGAEGGDRSEALQAQGTARGDDKARGGNRRHRSTGISPRESDGDGIGYSSATGGVGNDRISEQWPVAREQYIGPIRHAWKSRRWKHRSRCSSGARTGFCPCD